jgi:hypothetical protein
MKAEPAETPKSKPRINIPEGAMVILPLRNAVLFPSTIMPLVVGRPASLQAIEETAVAGRLRRSTRPGGGDPRARRPLQYRHRGRHT